MDSLQKIKSRQEICLAAHELQQQGKVVGFTSGSFDLLHAGHVDYLEKASSQSDILIVGVNSDSSIKKYKSVKRPIINQNDRSRLIAALACVDYVFTFDEQNNNKNIELLKPNIYFKAADYNKESLTSAPIIEAQGGEVRLIDLTPGLSTTSILEDISLRFHPSITEEIRQKPRQSAPAVLLDRDGTIIELVPYLHEIEKFKFIDGALNALKAFQAAGYRIVIITNQPGIGLGYFSKEDFFEINKILLKELSQAEVQVDKIYFCPHSKAENCECRKPKAKMIERAVEELNLDRTNSFVIGDMTSDVMLAKNAGCKSALVLTGQAGKDGLYDVKPDLVAKDLGEAADLILKGGS